MNTSWNHFFLEGKVKVELGLSNYAIKTDLKNGTGVDNLSFAKKTDLANLKSDVDKLDIVELKRCTKWFKQFKK